MYDERNSSFLSNQGDNDFKRPPGFLSFAALKKQYASFSIVDKTFKTRSKNFFRAGVVLGYDSETEELIVDNSDTHSIVFGATGSLKTRCIILPTMKVLGYGGESMIINDSKGELFDYTAEFLKEQGYEIKVINLRNPAVGNSWNPLYLPYKYYLENSFDKSSEFANDIASIITLDEVSHSDPYWDYSSYDCMLGLILLLFRYCKERHLSERYVNISNIIQLRRFFFQEGGNTKNTPLWRWAKQDELIAASLSGSVNAPENTRNSILSVLDQKLRMFSIQPTLLDLLANNDVTFADISKRKTAIFLITPDEKTTFHKLVSLFVKQSYEYLIYNATMKDREPSIRINYVLDEFSSLPAIKDFSSMISASRSRDIRFLLVTQSKNQLVHKYHEEAATIQSNCGNWIFLTSRELELLKDISELCGKSKNDKPNISIFELQHFNKDCAETLVMAGRNKPCIVRLLDIDHLDKKCGSTHKMPIIDEPKRQKRISLDFRPFINESSRP